MTTTSTMIPTCHISTLQDAIELWKNEEVNDKSWFLHPDEICKTLSVTEARQYAQEWTLTVRCPGKSRRAIKERPMKAGTHRLIKFVDSVVDSVEYTDGTVVLVNEKGVRRICCDWLDAYYTLVNCYAMMSKAIGVYFAKDGITTGREHYVRNSF